MKNLVVYMNMERVGVLQQTKSGAIKFTYNEAWLINKSAIPLSRSLPLQKSVRMGRKVRAYFAGILPEQEPRRTIAKILGISESNEYGMLERIGGECAGAVSLYPEGVKPPKPNSHKHQPLTKSELIQVIGELPNRPLMAGKSGLRLSLAGAQDKLPVIVHNDNICLPLNDTPSTHILKPEPSKYPGLAANEAFCMKLARAVGLKVPNIEYRRIGNKPYILVQRYDRIDDGHKKISRIHQEDFCQALGFLPDQKYQTEGGPTIKQCITLLREWSSVPAIDIPNFIKILIFNVLIGNADAHGKNFSFLYFNRDRILAPYYDLVSTIVWPNLSKDSAMKIGNCDSINAFGVGEWKKLAHRNKLSWSIIRDKIKDLSKIVLREIDRVQIQTNSNNSQVLSMLRESIGSRAIKMLDNLSAQGF